MVSYIKNPHILKKKKSALQNTVTGQLVNKHKH